MNKPPLQKQARLIESLRGLDPVLAAQMAARIKAVGFTFIALDLEGYRQGSLHSLLRAAK